MILLHRFLRSTRNALMQRQPQLLMQKSLVKHQATGENSGNKRVQQPSTEDIRYTLREKKAPSGEELKE